LERLCGDRGELDRLPSQTPVFALGEGEQRLEQPFLLLAGAGDLLAHLSQGGCVCVGIGECDLREDALGGDRAP
jgi:hypothetical protein